LTGVTVQLEISGTALQYLVPNVTKIRVDCGTFPPQFVPTFHSSHQRTTTFFCAYRSAIRTWFQSAQKVSGAFPELDVGCEIWDMDNEITAI